MKSALLLLILLAICLPLHADDWLTNSDFTDGNSHWYGQAKWPADFAPPDPFTKADPLTATGMIIPLRTETWVKECQDFKGKTANAILRVSFVVGPNTTFSHKPQDLQNVPDKIGWDAWLPFSADLDSMVIFITEIEKGHGRYQFVPVDMNSTKEQTMSAPVQGMTPWSQKTIAICVPPGTGSIVIHKVELVDPDAPASP